MGRPKGSKNKPKTDKVESKGSKNKAKEKPKESKSKPSQVKPIETKAVIESPLEPTPTTILFSAGDKVYHISTKERGFVKKDVKPDQQYVLVDWGNGHTYFIPGVCLTKNFRL